MALIKSQGLKTTGLGFNGTQARTTQDSATALRTHSHLANGTQTRDLASQRGFANTHNESSVGLFAADSPQTKALLLAALLTGLLVHTLTRQKNNAPLFAALRKGREEKKLEEQEALRQLQEQEEEDEESV